MANDEAAVPLSSDQQAMADVWAEHMKGEFTTRSVPETLATMTPDAHVNHAPVLTGAAGRDACGDFYGRWFIPQMPPDLEIVPVSRTIGAERLVDEMILRFTHSAPMAWMLPGVAPTGKPVEVALVAIITIRAGKVASEHIYWDQAPMLAQLGLLDAATLPIAGAESARKALDAAAEPSNALSERADRPRPSP